TFYISVSSFSLHQQSLLPLYSLWVIHYLTKSTRFNLHYAAPVIKALKSPIKHFNILRETQFDLLIFVPIIAIMTILITNTNFFDLNLLKHASLTYAFHVLDFYHDIPALIYLLSVLCVSTVLRLYMQLHLQFQLDNLDEHSLYCDLKYKGEEAKLQLIISSFAAKIIENLSHSFFALIVTLGLLVYYLFIYT